MKTCYIIGAGDIFTLPTPSEDDFVIAADGGYDHLISHGVGCDLLIGDLDSIKSEHRDAKVVTFPVRKDETDTYLAYREGVARGYSHFEIYGGTGGREDHTFANYSMLYYAAKQGHTARLHFKNMIAEVICGGTAKLHGNKGATFSVFAFGGDAYGVTIRNAEYEATDITLSPDFPLGVSNAFTDRTAEISVSRGALLVMYEK